MTESFKDAKNFAKSILKQWIQHTFYETFLQSLRPQLELLDDEIVISSEILENCNQICSRLAIHWQKRLRDIGQHDAADCVKEIADTGNFSHSGLISSDVNGEIDLDTDLKVREIDFASDAAVDARNHGETMSISKLHHLLSRESNLENFEESLNQMGKQGQTQWPLDWQIVEDYCTHDLVTRLHGKNPQVQFEIVPRDSVQEKDDDVIQSVRLKRLLKRKAVSPDLTRTKIRGRPRKQDGNTNDIEEESRPPSDQPQIVQWKWETIKDTIDNKESLERAFVHSNTELDPSITVQGQLRLVGHTELEIVNATKSLKEKVTDLQKRRLLTSCVKHRLEGSDIIRDSRRAPSSKVLRTRNKDEHFLEFDLMNCLVDLNGRLLAFSTLDVTLLDEDAATCDSLQSNGGNI
jgi:hypothetical protein